ncbi:MAG: UvrD-helicase domain-containing protein [Brumimicrobium sp.]|nr:UvrD-helicase domain-containing protein [Brumimicrobium sp.]
MLEKDKPLKVLSASAGSGKTFSLVQTYLELTIGRNAQSNAFSKIIAMTFTNKAALEMKTRIIEALDFIAFPERKTENERRKAIRLFEKTRENLKLPENIIRENARRVLSQILHNYEDFHVMTIDKFSLRLIRTFSKDLDLSDDFEIIMDERELLEQVVDELLSKIGKQGEEEVTRLTLAYAKSNLEEGTKWNFRSSLIEFARNLTVEKDREFIDELIQKPSNPDGIKELRAQINKLVQEYNTQATDLYNYFISLNSSPEDYPSKTTGIYRWLNELNGKKLEEYKPPTNTILKFLSGESINAKHNVDPELINKIERFFPFEKEAFDRFYVLNRIRKNFYNLALLKYIADELNRFKERHNVIGIYEFSRKISDLLSKESAPYIYERLGTRFSHYLLDEFQDTSRLQWLNLIPLLHDSISGGNKNLIVGDPKQAIYRFRNGLVDQFVALPNIYNPEEDPQLAFTSNYFNEMGIKLPLEENYRSKKNIVEFNNMFFKKCLEFLPATFNKFYKDIVQKPKGSEGGFIHFEFFEAPNKEEALPDREAFLLNSVRSCIRDGYLPGELCVLTRNKSDGNHCAKILTRAEEQFKVISADSLSVGSDKTVKFFIDYFELRKNSANETNQTKFASSYYQMREEEPLIGLRNYWGDRIGKLDFEKFVKDVFQSEEALFMDYENMYDLGQKFVRILNLNELSNPYLHHFMEILQYYDLKFGPDLRGFLDYWHSKAQTETVQMPANDEAIQIMTVHKSKGLEFPVVILPTLDWTIGTEKNESFIKTDQGELIYSKLIKKDVPDFMLKARDKEYKQVLLDELNLLYVAFTRAEDRIYGLVEKNKKGSDDYSKLSQLIAKTLNAMNETANGGEELFSMGSETKISSADKTIDNNFDPVDISDFLWFPEMSMKDSDAMEEEDLSDEQRFGNQLHKLLSQVDKPEVLNTVFKDMIKKDQIERRFENELEKLARNILEIPEYKVLLKNSKRILSEQDIILDEKNFLRPDKIILGEREVSVIDFKTGKALRKHENQVRNYVSAVRNMGYEEVRGYLLYTSENSLQEVK